VTTGGWRRAFRIDAGRGKVERDVNQEIAFHLEMKARKLVARGVDPAVAAATALDQFGDLSAVRDECLTIGAGQERKMRWSERIGGVMRDARYAARTLRAQATFTLAVVAILAIGIGANTSIFAVVDALLLRALPVPHPEQLITIGDPATVTDSWSGSPRTDYVSYPVYADLRDRNTVLSGLYATGATGELNITATAADEPQAVDHPRGRLVTGNYFAVLGVPAYAGRTFTVDDDRAPLQNPVAVISHGYWQHRFAGDHSAIGSTFVVNGTTFTIVGVTPPWFRGDIVGQSIAVFLPMTMQPAIRSQRSLLGDRSASWLTMMGRLKPGVSLERARAELTTLETQSIRANLSGVSLMRFDQDLARQPIRVEAGERGFSRERAVYGSALVVLMAAVGLIVLIVCANVANLMLARSTGRSREVTVRMALGAGRGRIVQQLLIESTMLAGAGAALGLLPAYWVSRLLLLMASRGDFPLPLDVAPNPTILAFTAGVTILSVLLFGVFPALQATRSDVATALRAQSRSLAGQRGRWGRFSAGKSLVVAQVALSTLLLVATALLGRSMQRILAVDLGFDRDHLVLVDVAAARSGYDDARRSGLLRDLTDRLRRVPGVTAVSSAQQAVFLGGESRDHIGVPGFVAAANSDLDVLNDVVGPRYFGTVGAQLLRGRDFEESDGLNTARVAVINETMAKHYFDARDPLERTVTLDSTAYTIVGVVRDLQDTDIRARPERKLYFSSAQRARVPRAFVLAVRVAGVPSAFVRPIHNAVVEADPRLSFDVNAVRDLVRQTVAQDVLVTRVTTVFGLLALGLAALGLYGVTAYATSQRTGEFGLRAALGAEPGDVMRMILREAVSLVMIGIVVGVPIGLVATRLIRERLFGVGPVDLPSFAMAIGVLTVASLVASYVPARRASRVGPLTALRSD